MLKRELVQQKTKNDNIKTVKNLNLWGQNLSDVNLIKDMINLEILSLSVNQISSLSSFENCTKLRELYLRKNNISQLSELSHLSNLTNLRKLNLSENPISFLEGYRANIVQLLPQVDVLDDKPVTNEERSGQLPIKENPLDYSYEQQSQPQEVLNETTATQRRRVLPQQQVSPQQENQFQNFTPQQQNPPSRQISRQQQQFIPPMSQMQDLDFPIQQPQTPSNIFNNTPPRLQSRQPPFDPFNQFQNKNPFMDVQNSQLINSSLIQLQALQQQQLEMQQQQQMLLQQQQQHVVSPQNNTKNTIVNAILMLADELDTENLENLRLSRLSYIKLFIGQKLKKKQVGYCLQKYFFS